MRIDSRGTWSWIDHRVLDDYETRSWIDRDPAKRITIWWFVK